MAETLKMIQGQAVADAWNEYHPIGREVILINDDGEREETKIESRAWILGDGTPVALVAARSWSFPIERIIAKPIAPTMTIQEAIDINTAARCTALQDAAKVCAGYANNQMAKHLTVVLLGMAHDAEPEVRDLELDWDPEIAALCDEWKPR